MGFGTKGLRNLSAALKHNAGLRMLLLNGAWRMPNKINGSNEGKGNEFKGGVKCLAEALKYNTTLTYLCLYGACYFECNFILLLSLRAPTPPTQIVFWVLKAHCI